MRLYYEEYLDQYRRSKKFALSRGAAIRKNTDNIQYPLSFNKFKVDYITAVSENPKKSWRRVAQSMAKNDVYPVTSLQASRYEEAHFKRYGETNINILLQYRLGFIPQVKAGGKTTDIFTDIMERREELRLSGSTKGEMRDIIAQEFFGRDY